MTIDGSRAAKRKAGHCFVGANAMRFFDSYCEEETFTCEKGTLFITSEKDLMVPRRYTLRFTVDGSEIKTIGEHCQFSTVKEAIHAAKKARDKETED